MILKNIIAILALNLALISCDNKEFIKASRQHFPISLEDSGMLITFLGTSSFLIQTPKKQLLLDGFVSRPKHNLLGTFQPRKDRIKEFLKTQSVCKSIRASNLEGQSSRCQEAGHPHLDLAIAMHGHFDHALDTPYIAGWAGSRFLVEKSLKRITEATKQLKETQGNEFNWNSVQYENLNDYLGSDPEQLLVDEMELRLAETLHGKNPISNRIDKVTSDRFKFRTSIWRMGEGKSISLLIEHRKRRVLFTASAGEIGDSLKSAGITKADVVFLSIGGLGRNTPEERERYWRQTVTATGAKRVFLIHWDNIQKALPKSGKDFSVPFIEKHDITLEHFQALAKSRNVQITFAPPLTPFDPFFNIGSIN